MSTRRKFLTQPLAGACALPATALVPVSAAPTASAAAGTSGVFAVRSFGGVGDGRPHPLSERYASLAAARAHYAFASSLNQPIDFCALQAAVNSAGASGGGTVFVEPGTWWLGSEQPLRITQGNVELIGAGPSSVLFIANWQTTANTAADGHIVIGATDSSPLANVRIAHLKVQGTKDWLEDHGWYGSKAVPWNAIVFGQKGTTINCGVESCRFENTGGSCVGVAAGRNDNAVDADAGNGFYARHNYIDNTIFSGIDVFTGGLRNADISHNSIRRCSGGGILYSGTSGRIQGNTIEYTMNYGIGAAGYRGKGDYTHVTDNKLFRCGAGVGRGKAVSPAMYFGDAATNNYLFVANNAITDAYGPGIFVLPGAEDIVLQCNTVHGFGYQGAGKSIAVPGAQWCGVQALNSKRVVVHGNVVHAGAAPGYRAETGIAVGGNLAEDCFADSNTTLGNYQAQPFAFSCVHGGPSPRTGIRMGSNNFDVATRQRAEPLDHLNNRALPRTPPGAVTLHANGARILVVANSTATVVGRIVGSLGDVLTLVFQDGNTTIANGGEFTLRGGNFVSAAGRTLSLVQAYSGSWVEIART